VGEDGTAIAKRLSATGKNLFTRPAFFRAVLHALPIPGPLLPPLKFTRTTKADLGRKPILYLRLHAESLYFLIASWAFWALTRDFLDDFSLLAGNYLHRSRVFRRRCLSTLS